jgi:membrane protein implicated in regulation of membrane protease activity
MDELPSGVPTISWLCSLVATIAALTALLWISAPFWLAFVIAFIVGGVVVASVERILVRRSQRSVRGSEPAEG